MSYTPSSKNNSALFVVIIGIVIILAGIISYLYLKQTATAPSINTTPSTTLKTTNHYVSEALGLSFDFPTIFELAPDSKDNPKLSLTSKYFVKVDFVGEGSDTSPAEPRTPTSPPHYFRITFENRALPLVEAMKQDNQFFADTYNDFLLHKKPKTEIMDVSQIGGKDAQTFSLGAEGINSKYTYIQRSTMDTTVITLTYIGDVLKESIQPSPISESLQLEIFNNVLASVKFN